MKRKIILIALLAAALCLFMAAKNTAEKNAILAQAELQAQTAVETLQTCGGDMAHATLSAAEQLGGLVEQGLWCVLYDENWNVLSGWDWENAAYSLEAQGVPTGVEGLWKAEVWVTSHIDGQEILFSTSASWEA